MNRRLWMLLIVLSGCSPKPAARLPMKVAPEEYEVYSAWLRQHFPKQPSGTLYLATRTNSWTLWHCDSNPLRAAGGDEELLRQLEDLGEAEFPLDLQTAPMQVPWAFKIAYGPPPDQEGPYEEVIFSRVAFNPKHTEALFGAGVVCGGLCGGGGTVIGRRENGTWVFRNGGCSWVS